MVRGAGGGGGEVPLLLLLRTFGRETQNGTASAAHTRRSAARALRHTPHGPGAPATATTEAQAPGKRAMVAAKVQRHWKVAHDQIQAVSQIFRDTLQQEVVRGNAGRRACTAHAQ